jgi:methyltransferase (TIGR00027 family)
MTDSEGAITHVSDTGLWVAMYRAMENDRPDAIFKDPHARRLAGPRGESIVRAMPQGMNQAWAMIVRTKVFDEILLGLITEQRIDEVLNLAAGLDVRPYRLPLPATLRWTDVDFPDVINYKTDALVGEKAVCTYEGVGLDLADVEARRALFDKIDARSQRVAIVSEGLLVYLDAAQVSSLAADLSARLHFAYWIIDLANSLLLQYMNQTWGKRLPQERARFQFALDDRPAFFEPLGWQEIEYRANWSEARRLNRRMRLSWLWDIVAMVQPPARKRQFQNMAGSILMARK